MNQAFSKQRSVYFII